MCQEYIRWKVFLTFGWFKPNLVCILGGTKQWPTTHFKHILYKNVDSTSIAYPRITLLKMSGTQYKSYPGQPVPRTYLGHLITGTSRTDGKHGMKNYWQIMTSLLNTSLLLMCFVMTPRLSINLVKFFNPMSMNHMPLRGRYWFISN